MSKSDTTLEFIAAIMLQPRTPEDLQGYAGLKRKDHVKQCLHNIHSRGVIRVESWKLADSHWTPAYGMQVTPYGKPDAPRPPGARDPERVAWKNFQRAHPDAARQWTGFDEFISDLGLRPSPEHRLLRIDLTKPHARLNLAWICP